MFETPGAKRVKRAEFFEDDREVPSINRQHDDKELEETVPDYGFEYDYIEPTALESAEPAKTDDVFQFNLFRTTPKPQSEVDGLESHKSGAQDTQTALRYIHTRPALISIRSPTPEVTALLGEGALQRSRPDSFYFTASGPSSQLQQKHERCEQSAVSGEIILKDSSRTWPGTHLSWRILSLPAHPKQIVVNRANHTGSKLHSEDSAAGLSKPMSLRDPVRRPRPSKKRRDLLKRKFVHRQALIDETKTKEEHEKEKRNKKNRERKIKRRAKERREKYDAQMEPLAMAQEEAR